MENRTWFRTYLFIWTGQFVSMLTSYAVNFAIIIWLSLKLQSAEVLAFSAIAGMLPQAVMGPFAGVFIDRWNRKTVMIAADAFIALCTFGMTFVLKDGQADLRWVYLLMACRSAGTAFHSPAVQAIAPLIVPDKELLRVSGINQMLVSVSSIAGPAVGTLAISGLSISQVLYLDVLGAIVAISSLLFVSIPKVAQSAEISFGSVIRDLKDGIGAISAKKGLYYLFVYAMAVTFFVMPVAILFPLLTTGHYAGGKWEMGLVETVWGVGMLIGGSLIGLMRVRLRKVILINSMYIVLGLSFVLSGVFPSPLFAGFVLVTALGGMSMSIFSAAFMATIQEEVVPEKLGRVFSLYFSMAVLPSLIGLLFTGFIAENIGITRAFMISGSLIIVIGIASFVTKKLMRLGERVI